MMCYNQTLEGLKYFKLQSATGKQPVTGDVGYNQTLEGLKYILDRECVSADIWL
ncbi:MAG: hypothetical protein A8273_1916 [Methanohalophilus sp. 2-GBenrich]|nr:MAG: hypothetical protein A8273_1916 [Methanohalophilus sp. 2-GBenrich]